MMYGEVWTDALKDLVLGRHASQQVKVVFLGCVVAAAL